MSAERDELRRLVEQLSDDRVPAVLAEARRQSGAVPSGEWPPPWFGSFASGRSDLGSDHEDLPAEGFGRPLSDRLRHRSAGCGRRSRRLVRQHEPGAVPPGCGWG